MTARAGKVCGSELKNLITDKGAIRSFKTEMPQKYLHRKLAEKWRGQPLESFFAGNRQTTQGNIWEPQARRYCAALMDCDIVEVGGIESDDGKLWCSPDGIIGENVGLEIKAPNPDTHIGWLLEGGVPEEHVLQVQFALYVTDWPQWQFLSYCKDLPHLAVTVERNPELFDTIIEAVFDFNERFEAAWKRLCEINGGPPPPRQTFIPSAGPIRFSWECSGEDVPT